MGTTFKRFCVVDMGEDQITVKEYDNEKDYDNDIDSMYSQFDTKPLAVKEAKRLVEKYDFKYVQQQSEGDCYGASMYTSANR